MTWQIKIMRKRIALDLLMLVLFLAVMSFHFIPKMLHEVLGLALLLAAIMHLIWNYRWLGALRQGRWSGTRLFAVVINLLLMLALVVVFVTGVCLSNHIFKGWIPLELARNITIHQIHVSLPFLLLIIIGLHLGLHLKSWWQRLKKTCCFRGNLLYYRLFAKGTALIFIGLGSYGSFQNRIGDHLLMKHIFATPATSSSGSIYVLLLIAIMGLYAIVAYVWQEWRSKKERRKMI